MKRMILTVGFGLLLGITFGAGQARGDVLAFDFDHDGDPNTVVSEIEAEVGTLVEAFLIVNKLLYEWQYTHLHGLQFGLEATDGLEFLGMSLLGDRAMVINDGLDGIAISFGEPLPIADLPAFAVRFVFRVVADVEQVVRAKPSTGFNHPLEGVLFAVSANGGPLRSVESTIVLQTQSMGYVNKGSVVLPYRHSSWGAIKRLFSDETI